MKRSHLAFLLACTLLAAPAAAQSSGAAGYDFLEAVKKSDSNKAFEVLGSHSRGIVDTKDNEGNTGLIIAINRSDEAWTGFMLNHGADPNVSGKSGDTPLIAASRVGFEQAIGWLLALGARVDGANKMGETPLIVAVQQRRLAVVRVLLDKGANSDKPDSAAGYSARDYATRDPRARDILKLIDAGKTKRSPAKVVTK